MKAQSGLSSLIKKINHTKRNYNKNLIHPSKKNAASN